MSPGFCHPHRGHCMAQGYLWRLYGRSAETSIGNPLFRPEVGPAAPRDVRETSARRPRFPQSTVTAPTAASHALGAEEPPEVRDREPHGATLLGEDQPLLDQPVPGR